MGQGREDVRRKSGVRVRMIRMALSIMPVAALLALLAAPAAAQDYPVRPITLIVPYAAGGGNDVMARIVADKMSAALGQPIVIENRGGAGGSLATRQVARAEADGYTLGLGGTGTLAIDPTLYQNVGYDPRKDFAPVGLIATSALVVLVNPAVPAKTIPELIALARREPASLPMHRPASAAASISAPSSSPIWRASRSPTSPTRAARRP